MGFLPFTGLLLSCNVLISYHQYLDKTWQTPYSRYCPLDPSSQPHNELNASTGFLFVLNLRADISKGTIYLDPAAMQDPF